MPDPKIGTPSNAVLVDLRKGAIDIFMHLGNEVGGALLANKYGVDHPSRLPARDLIGAIDDMQAEADAIVARDKAAAEAAKANAEAAATTAAATAENLGETAPVEQASDAKGNP